MSELAVKTYDAEYFRGQFQAEKERSASSSTPYLKLTGGQNDLRLLPCAPPFVKLRKHTYRNHEGRITSGLDYGYLLSMPEVMEAAQAQDRLSAGDIELAQAFGDPFTTLATQAQALGIDKKRYSQLWPRTRYLWNAVDRTEGEPSVQLFESSKQFFEQVMGLVENKYPDLFHPETGFDLGILGNGQDGLQRRYGAATPDREASPVGFDFEEDLIDLEGQLVKAIRPWTEKATAVLSAHAEIASEVGITAETWGL